MERTDPPRPRRAARAAAAALSALLLALALVACAPPQQYPRGVTDSDMWERSDIRVDTEVPNQYPNGTTRANADEHSEGGYGEEGDDGH